MHVVKSHTCMLLITMQLETHLAIKMVIFYDLGCFIIVETHYAFVLYTISCQILAEQCAPPIGHLCCFIVFVCFGQYTQLQVFS